MTRGGTQPEAERKRRVVAIRLSPEARLALDTMAALLRESRSAVVERLVLQAATRS